MTNDILGSDIVFFLEWSIYIAYEHFVVLQCVVKVVLLLSFIEVWSSLS